MSSLAEKLEVWGFEEGRLIFKDMSLGAVLKVAAKDISCATDEELNTLHQVVADFLNGLPAGLSIQFMQMTANPVDIRLTERRELIKEVAKSLDLDPDKMVPEMSEQDEAQQKEEGAKEIQKQEAAYEMEMQRVQAQTAKAQAQAQQAMADSQRSMVDAQTLPMEREAEAARDFAYAEQTRQDIQLGKSPTGFDQ